MILDSGLLFGPPCICTYIIINQLAYQLKLSEWQWYHLVIEAHSKPIAEKRITDNRMQNRIWNSCLDFITKEIWCLKSPELHPLDYYVWENIQGQSRVAPKTEDIDELEDMLKMTI